MQFHVSEEHRGLRLDHFLSAQTGALSRSRLQRLIQSGHVLLNGAPTKPSAKLHANDIVALDEPPAVPDENLPEEMALEILHEDDDILVLNKPAGMVVHPAAGNRQHTLVNALLHHCKNLSGIGGSQRPGIVHRLDKETSGCLVIAKNDAAHQNLSRQFSDRAVLKIYLVLVQGRLKKEKGVIETSIGRHPVHRKKMAVVDTGRGREAKTEYRVAGVFGSASLVECKLHTGRTHQIRVHLKHLGHPVLGDKLYGARTSTAHSRQMLHAWKLGFSHPHSGRWMEFESPIPPDFADAAPGLSLKP